ncbi:MAG: large subunit ribosomal protein L4 [Candidatus Berkelbacteria bacterium Gr01-1014_85]|uniref:Large ribosomal subunit protein uL4 n=1 Tax=Candidatus Berkelbacteria bacterium Gr01-1014_85 TaxID=2017150 RepID=A0A554JD38_9BACT|nr:MAG: large subunit ribosomal protein L4 [Candidatus Berkelbacteria bacterium Gr01-1014_85]
MHNIPYFTATGEAGPALDLPTTLAVEPNHKLLHQAVTIYLANLRHSQANTKTKGEVRGGGRKPHKQKGTGRARAGSSRSPIWTGGGITFGPRSNRNYQLSLPQAMRQRALAMAINSKLVAGQLLVIEDLSGLGNKTQTAAKLINKIAPEAKKRLLIDGELNAETTRSLANLDKAQLMAAYQLNALHVLRGGQLILTKAGLDLLTARLEKKS